ncbi:MAG: type II secretion system F family protein [Candidatus Omnitrophica bacterium]|nr:type II secretion system F family protein [Candidatus Omnitrophota bacterium]
MVIPFTRQLYILIKSGIPLLRALQVNSVQLPKGKFKDAIDGVIQEIQEGKNLSEALLSNRKFFSLFYINMVKAGEVTGNLTAVLKELSEHLVQHDRIRQQVRAAFMYPIFILVVAVIILTVLLMFVLPIFTRIFADLGGTLPPATLFLIWLSKVTIRWGWLVFLIVGSAVMGLVILVRKSPRGSYVVNDLVWKIPLFGMLVKTMELGRYCRTLGTLLSSGVTLVKALEVLFDTTESSVLHKAIEDIRFNIEQGKSLSAAMDETKVFPLTLVSLTQIGEESGKLADIFVEAAKDYEDEVEYSIKGLLSLLEPALILIMGAIVGFIVIALFFPIFTMSVMVK